MYNNWCADPEVCKFFTWNPHSDINETLALVKMWIDAYQNPLTYHWIIVNNETNREVGSIYLDRFSDEDKSAAVSCIISKTHWGKGLAAEATKAVVRYAFREIGLNRVDSHHHEENIGSGKALIKSRFRFIETRFVSYSECSRIDGNYRFYAIGRDEFI